MKQAAFLESRAHRSLMSALAVTSLLSAAPVFAASLSGQVLGGGAPIANSTVTLWAASAGAPKQLAQARSGADGRFTHDGSRLGSRRYQPVSGRQGRPADCEQGERRQPRHRAHDGAGQQAAGQGHDQRVHDRRVGVDPRAVSRRHRDQGSRARACASPRAMCRVSSIFRRVAGGTPSKTRSTAARRQRWPTSPRSPTRSPVASRG